MPSLDESKFFVSVYNCRLCGSVISSDQGVRRHEQVCRIPHNVFPRNKLRQMNMVKFPCPLVTLQRIPFLCGEDHLNPGEEVKSESDTGNRHHRHRRQSSLRALDIMSRTVQGYSSEEDDTEKIGKEEEEEEEEEDALEPTESKMEAQDHIDTKPKRTRRHKDTWGKSFRRKVNVNEENKYVCPMNGCGARLKYAQHLKVHFTMHLENNPYACPVPGCLIKCGTHHHFNRHINWHLGKNILSCGKCGQECADNTRLKRHLSKCKGQRYCQPNQRDVIGLSKMTDILKSHYANLESKGLLGDDKARQDELDDDDDDDKLGLLKMYRRINMDKIIEQDPVFLQVSKENPEFENNLPKAKWTTKLGESKKFQCPKCSKSYQNASCYKEHFNNAHRSRPYTCSKCGRNYVSKLHLKKHMKYHELTGKNIYMKQLKNGYRKCMMCKFQSKCRQRASMTRHWLLVHNVTIPVRKYAYAYGSDLKEEDEDLPVIKIESEPALELAMIVPNDMNNLNQIQRVKIEPILIHTNQDHHDPLESLVKCEFETFP